MATTKNRSVKWLTIHVLAYAAALSFFALFIFDFEIAMQFVFVNAILHWITDFFTSKIIVKYLQNPRIFFPLLGMDQLIHTLCLYWTYENVETFIF